MPGSEASNKATIAAPVGSAVARKDFSAAAAGALALAPRPRSSSFRAASAPHAASAMPASSTGVSTLTSFQVGAGTFQSDTHSARLLLIQIDQSRQMTENTPMMRKV